MSRFGESSLNLDAVLDDKRAEILKHVDPGMRDQAADILGWAGDKLAEVASRCPSLCEHLRTVIDETLEEHWAEIVSAAEAEAKRENAAKNIYYEESDPDAYIEGMGRLLIGAQQDLAQARLTKVSRWMRQPVVAEVVVQ
jgi:hypothetical protein